jgi:hypothetical protein
MTTIQQEVAMINRRTLLVTALATVAMTAPVFAHHGWGSYDANTVLTLDGTVAEIDPNNPHGELKLKTADKTWIVTLSPPARMAARGKPLTEIKAGDKVVAVGYPSRSRPDEMRAERITHNGFTVELR